MKNKNFTKRIWLNLEKEAFMISISAGLILFFLSFFLHTTNATTTQNLNQSKKCNTSIDCLINASKRCLKSTGVFKTQYTFSVPVIKSELYLEIKGSDKTGQCTLYFKQLANSATLKPSLIKTMQKKNIIMEKINEFKSAIEAAGKAQVGKEATCIFKKNNDLTNLLKNIKRGNLSQKPTCTKKGNGSVCEVKTSWDVAKCQ